MFTYCMLQDIITESDNDSGDDDESDDEGEDDDIQSSGGCETRASNASHRYMYLDVTSNTPTHLSLVMSKDVICVSDKKTESQEPEKRKTVVPKLIHGAHMRRNSSKGSNNNMTYNLQHDSGKS